MNEISEKAIKLIKDLRRDIWIDVMFTPEKNAEDESLKALVDYIAELEGLIERLIDIGDWATVGMVISNLYSQANEMEMREFAAKRRDEWKTLVKDWKEGEE